MSGEGRDQSSESKGERVQVTGRPRLRTVGRGEELGLFPELREPRREGHAFPAPLAAVEELT